MRTIILLIVYTLLAILAIPLLLLCYMIRSKQPVIIYSKWTMRVGQIILGIRLEVYGQEKIDRTKPFIYMSNHMSILDGPLLFMLVPQAARVLLKKEVLKIPVVGHGMRLVGFVPVDRKGIRGGKKSIDRATKLIEEKGYSFLIFPEGTRSLDGRMQPFKRGGFFLAVKSRAAILPITLEGSYELMPKGSFFAKRGKISVIFHPPLPTHGYDIDSLPGLMGRTREIIESGLDEDSISMT